LIAVYGKRPSSKTFISETVPSAWSWMISRWKIWIRNPIRVNGFETG
jgi:hypothetical protein